MVLSPLHQPSNDLDTINILDGVSNAKMRRLISKGDVINITLTRHWTEANWGLVVAIEPTGIMYVDRILTHSAIWRYNQTSDQPIQVGDFIVEIESELVPITETRFRRLMSGNSAKLTLIRLPPLV